MKYKQIGLVANLSGRQDVFHHSYIIRKSLKSLC